MSTGSSGTPSDVGSPGSTNPVSAPNPDVWTGTSMAGEPMGGPSSGGGYATGPNTGAQPDVSVPGGGPPGFFFKVENFADPEATFNFTQPPALSGFSPDRGRPELSEPGATPSTVVGVLGGNNPGGPQVTAVSGPNPTSSAVGGPVSTVGNAPIPPGSLLDASIVNADHSTAANGVIVGMIGPANGPSGQPSRLPGRDTNRMSVYHMAVRSSSESADPAVDGPIGAIPSPQGADLIVEALPIAGRTLETALDEFVRQLDHLDAGLLVSRGPAPIVVFSLSLLSAAASAELARRYLRRRTSLKRGILAVDSSGRELTLGFPELPGSWSERRV